MMITRLVLYLSAVLMIVTGASVSAQKVYDNNITWGPWVRVLSVGGVDFHLSFCKVPGIDDKHRTRLRIDNNNGHDVQVSCQVKLISDQQRPYEGKPVGGKINKRFQNAHDASAWQWVPFGDNERIAKAGLVKVVVRDLDSMKEASSPESEMISVAVRPSWGPRDYKYGGPVEMFKGREAHDEHRQQFVITGGTFDYVHTQIARVRFEDGGRDERQRIWTMSGNLADLDPDRIFLQDPTYSSHPDDPTAVLRVFTVNGRTLAYSHLTFKLENQANPGPPEVTRTTALDAYYSSKAEALRAKEEFVKAIVAARAMR